MGDAVGLGLGLGWVSKRVDAGDDYSLLAWWFSDGNGDDFGMGIARGDLGKVFGLGWKEGVGKKGMVVEL